MSNTRALEDFAFTMQFHWGSYIKPYTWMIGNRTNVQRLFFLNKSSHNWVVRKRYEIVMKRNERYLRCMKISVFYPLDLYITLLRLSKVYLYSGTRIFIHCVSEPQLQEPKRLEFIGKVAFLAQLSSFQKWVPKWAELTF